MFSQTTEYALRAVVYLAAQGGEPRTLRQIARATRVPADYLSKVLQGLRRDRLVHSQRGVGGGLTLGVPPPGPSVSAAVQAVPLAAAERAGEPTRRTRTGPRGRKAHITRGPLPRPLDEARDMVESALRRPSTAELLAEPARERGVPIPLCPWPGPARDGAEKP